MSVVLLMVRLVIQGLEPQADAIASQRFGEAPDHPLVGAWMLRQAPENPGEPWALAPAEFRADGTAMLAWPARHDRDGDVVFATLAMGTWRPTGPREGRFTAAHAVLDANGHVRGTVTIEGSPVVSASGQTFVDLGLATMEIVAIGFARLGAREAGTPRPGMATRILPGHNDGHGPCGPLLPFCE